MLLIGCNIRTNNLTTKFIIHFYESCIQDTLRFGHRHTGKVATDDNTLFNIHIVLWHFPTNINTEHRNNVTSPSIFSTQQWKCICMTH